MLLPPSFETAFWEQRLTAEEIEKLADPALRIEVCKPRGWLFDARLKDAESALARLEVGPVKRLSGMRDLYAATVVVPTRRDLAEAVKAIIEAFPESRVQRRRLGSADTFSYDDVHVFAKLGDRIRATNAGLADREFEVQVRTGLQFAWWRATHDILYKGQPGTWRLRRVAAQARASLELLDTTLADLAATANLLDEQEDVADAEATRRAGWIDAWSEPQRPKNLVRFADSAATLLNAAGVTLDDAEALLASDRAGELRMDITITPVQVVVALLVEAHGVAWAEALDPPWTRVLVTEELARLVPDAADIHPDHRSKVS